MSNKGLCSPWSRSSEPARLRLLAAATSSRSLHRTISRSLFQHQKHLQPWSHEFWWKPDDWDGLREVFPFSVNILAVSDVRGLRQDVRLRARIVQAARTVKCCTTSQQRAMYYSAQSLSQLRAKYYCAQCVSQLRAASNHSPSSQLVFLLLPTTNPVCAKQF